MDTTDTQTPVSSQLASLVKKKGATRACCFGLDHHLAEQVDQMATRLNATRSEVLRVLVTLGLEASK